MIAFSATAEVSKNSERIVSQCLQGGLLYLPADVTKQVGSHLAQPKSVKVDKPCEFKEIRAFESKCCDEWTFSHKLLWYLASLRMFDVSRRVTLVATTKELCRFSLQSKRH
jgi:hypothetical protein